MSGGRKHFVTSDGSRPIDFRKLTVGEFVRMSSSLQLTLLVIRRAQRVSRQVVAATSNWTERYGGREAVGARPESNSDQDLGRRSGY